jgi:hypothetical protein
MCAVFRKSEDDASVQDFSTGIYQRVERDQEATRHGVKSNRPVYGYNFPFIKQTAATISEKERPTFEIQVRA